jgi:ribosomal protein S27AE
MKKPKQWWYFIIDNDAKTFCNMGLVTTEVEWNLKVENAMKAGRNVRAASQWTEQEAKSLETYYTSQGYTKVTTPPVETPLNRSSEYKGVLPEYAQRADRKRIVKFLCGKCNSTRFGEMNQDYPGTDVLRDDDSGIYRATCLKCGYITGDSYNWIR